MIRIAIDGPSGAGKSTVAKRIAHDLSIIYVDTGAMYRCIGLYVLRQGLDTKNEKQVLPCLAQIELHTTYDPQAGQRIFLNGEDVSEAIRSPEASMAASEVTYEEILQDILRRDQQDSSRAAAPLRKADDAVLIDSTNLTFEQTVDAIKKLIVQRAAALSLSI